MMTKHPDQVGRILGIAVFLAGIALLALIFAATLRMLTHPVPELAAIIHNASQPLKPGQAPPPSAFPAIGAAVIAFISKLVLLLLGVIVGSIISSQGIRLYFTAAASGHAPASPSLTLSDAAPRTGGEPSSPRSSTGNQ